MKVTFILISILLLTGCGKNESTKNENVYKERKAAEQARFESGAFIVNEKHISSTETIRTIIVPAKYKVFDVNCVIYTNKEYKVAQMQCPDMTIENLDK